MPLTTSCRRGFMNSITLGLVLMAAGALPVGFMLVIERLPEKFLQPQNLPTALIGIVAMGYGAVFLGVIVLAWGIVSWLFGSRRQN